VNYTTAKAAELAGITPASFRREMHRERERGRDHRAPREQWPDARTPLWDESTLDAWYQRREGSWRQSRGR
jgi:hypothetical protein